MIKGNNVKSTNSKLGWLPRTMTLLNAKIFKHKNTASVQSRQMPLPQLEYKGHKFEKTRIKMAKSLP